MVLYLFVGVIFNFVSYVGKVVIGRYGLLFGVFGVIMMVFVVVCIKILEGRFVIIFFLMFMFIVGNVLKVIIVMDIVGMILGWKFFDYVVYFGGVFFGIWYVIYGYELIWKNREFLVKIWYEIRINGFKKGGGIK